ncbi:MAG: hypothetical protein QQN63_00240 [Nitrosopumilus sp.]
MSKQKDAEILGLKDEIRQLEHSAVGHALTIMKLTETGITDEVLFKLMRKVKNFIDTNEVTKFNANDMFEKMNSEWATL